MKEEVPYKLPEGWVSTTLREVSLPIVRINRDYQNSNESFKYIDIESIDNERFVIKDFKSFTWGNAPSRAQQKIKANDILFANVRPYLKNITIIPSLLDDQIASTGFCVIRPLIINPKFVFYYVLSQTFIDTINKLATGTSYPAVTNNIILEQSIVLAPVNEQNRIVEKIEEFFSELDQVIKGLKKAHQQLEIYKQAVLKNAFEGKLTINWRKQNKPAYQITNWIEQTRQKVYNKKVESWKIAKEQWVAAGENGNKPMKPAQIKTVEPFSSLQLEAFSSLPKSYWEWIKLNQVTLGVEYGTSIKSLKQGKVPVLRMGNIQNGAFDWSDLVFTNDEVEISKYLLKNGDVLFNRTNSPELVGKAAIYESERTAIFAGYLIRINHISDIVNSKYINYFLNSPVAKKYGHSIKTNGVNQSNINGDKLINYPVPICTILEQVQIIEELDSRFTIIENLETAINNGLQKVQIFRYSILKKAFEGKLVSQNANDEHASFLLEKIQKGKQNYLSIQKDEIKLKPKRLKMPEKNNLSVLQILTDMEEPILAKDLWMQSKHKENIEEFYAELKEIRNQLIEVKNETESLLSLKK